METHTLAVIGGGNMASSLIGGLLGAGWARGHIRVSEPDAERRRLLMDRFGIDAAGDNMAAVVDADLVLIAVKPPVVSGVAREIGPRLASTRPLVVCIAAGVREPDLRGWLGFEAAIVRAMPNTPALVGSGVSGLFANHFVSPAQRDLAESVLRAVGMIHWIHDEDLMDTVTAVSGSGPAYFFLLMELLEEAGIGLGLEAGSARLLALETALGAAKMALSSNEDPATLRQRVTSPGGTTERALEHLERGGLRELFTAAVRAARDRARELGEELGRA